MFERSIGIRLTLLPAFAEATKLILSNIGEINKGLQSINEQGSKINVNGLQTLNKELSSLVGAAGAAKTAIEALNGIKISKSTLSALEIGMTGVAKSAKVAKEAIKETEVQVAQTATVVEAKTAEMTKGFFNLAEEVMFAEKALAKLALFAMPKMTEPIVGMKNLTAHIMLAEQAMRRLDTFVPKNLEDTVMRLNSGLRNMVALSSGAGASPMALGPGPSWSTGSNQYGTRNMSLGAGGTPEEARPWSSVTGDRPNMLGSGNWAGNNITPYGQRNVTPGSSAYESGYGGQSYSGAAGAITPYVQDLGQGRFIPKGVPGRPDYGAMPPAEFGNNVAKFGSAISRFGDQTQSFGWSAIMPAMMAASVAVPAITSQMDLQDLYAVAHEALQASNVRPEHYAANMKGAEDVSTKFGGSLRENISGVYTFISSLPTAIDLNNQKNIDLMNQSYEQITKGGLVGGRSTHPVSQEHAILDILASVSNLGMPMKNAVQLSQSINTLTDVYTNIKNRTSTDFDLLGSSVRNIGAIAHNMGISWEDTMTMVGLLAKGKYRGSVAGTSMKRLFSRQTMDPAQARKVEETVAHFGGNVSMFDHGKVRSPLDWIADVAKFEDQHLKGPQFAKARMQLEGGLSGLYPGAPFGEMVNLSRVMGGSKGFAEFKKSLIGGAPGATDRAAETRDMGGKNIKFESQKIDNTWQLEMAKTFKMMGPDIINVLHSIQDLIKVWDGLSDPVKESTVRIAAFTVALLGITGIAAIFIGNFTKIGGFAISAGGNFIKLSEHLLGCSGAANILKTSLVDKLAASTRGILAPALTAVKTGLMGMVRAFAASDIAIAATELLLGPVGWIILGIGAITGGFALAWSKDWGGIREKVANFPAFLGEIVGHIQVWFGHIPEHLRDAGNKIKEIWTGLWDGVFGIFKNIWQGIKDIISGGFHFPAIHVNWPHPPDWWGKTQEEFRKGQAKGVAAEEKSEGITHATFGTSPMSLLSGGNQGGAADLSFLTNAPVSKPAGPIGPTLAAAHRIIQKHAENVAVVNSFVAANPDLASSGGGGGGYTPAASPVAPIVQAAAGHAATVKSVVNSGASDQEVADAIAALFDPSKKVKKHKVKQGIADGFLELKSLSIAQVEESAAKITAALEKAGAKIHKTWIDILDLKTMKVTRVHGDLSAYKAALGTTTKDDSVQIAHDYLMKIKREIEHGVPVDTDKVLANMAILYSHAMSDHAKNVILQMGDTIAAAFHKAGDKINQAFEKKKAAFDTNLREGATTRAGDKFDLLQEQMGGKVPTLGESPTTKDLTSVIKAETAERNALASTLLNEKDDAKDLATKYAELTAEIDKLNGKSAYEQKIRQEKKAELAALQPAYDAVTARIAAQQGVVDNLSASILKQNEALKIAKDTWSGLFYNIQQHNVSTLIDQNFKGLGDHIQNYFQRQNLPTGSAGNSWRGQQANDFANQFMQQLMTGITGASGSTSMLEKIFHAGTKGNKKTGQPPTQAETQYIQKADEGNKTLSKIEKNTQYLNPSTVKSVGGSSVANANGIPMPVAVFDQNGSTDVGQSLLDTQNAILNNTASVTYGGGTASSNQASDQSTALTSMQKFQQVANDISTGMSLLNGLKAGGIGGALQAGSAAQSLAGAFGASVGTSNTIALITSALGFLGIGPHTTPAQAPDINNPQYGQNTANWSGSQQLVNGQQIQPNAQYSSYMGAQNEATQMYNYVSNPASQIGMNPAQQLAIQQMAALSKNSKGVDMGAAGLAITSEHQGVLTLADGQKISVTDFDNLLNTTQGMLSQFQNNALQQQQNADRLASSFTAMLLNGPAGFTMPDFVGGGSGQAGINHVMPTASVGNNNLRTTQSTPTTQTVNVQIMPGATIHGATVETVQTAIENSIPQITQAVNAQNYGAARFSGNYTSNTW
jgi:hypothetical protein